MKKTADKFFISARSNDLRRDDSQWQIARQRGVNWDPMYRKIPMFLAGVTRTIPLPKSWTISQETTQMPKMALPGVEPPSLFIWPEHKHIVCRGCHYRRFAIGEKTKSDTKERFERKYGNEIREKQLISEWNNILGVVANRWDGWHRLGTDMRQWFAILAS